MEKMVLEQKLRRGLEEQSAKPQRLPTSTASVSEGEGVGGDEGRERGDKGGRRGEAGNEALRSFAKSSSGQRRHGGTEAQTSFSSFKRDKKTFCKLSHMYMLYIVNVHHAIFLIFFFSIHTYTPHPFVQLWMIIPKFYISYRHTGGRQNDVKTLNSHPPTARKPSDSTKKLNNYSVFKNFICNYRLLTIKPMNLMQFVVYFNSLLCVTAPTIY